MNDAIQGSIPGEGARPKQAGDAFEITPVAHRAVRVTVAGKLRGSRARHLGDHLQELVEEGVRRLVLDLQGTAFLDSLGALAIEQALERGLRIHLVVTRSFSFEGTFSARALSRPPHRTGLRVHHDLAEALATVREIQDSGLVLA